MPKAKPTQVITHRIELGEWERQNIGRPLADTAQVASVGVSIGTAAFGVAAVGATYAIWKLWDVFSYAKEKVEAAVDVADAGWDAATSVPGTPRTIDKILAILSL